MKLLYHSLAGKSLASPFDVAILEVAAGHPIKIVSPYIGLSYLKRLLGISSDWTLVSDVEEWLSAARNERREARAFIESHSDKIHHYPSIHAKAVIGPHKAYLGSANLTTSGIQLRTEVGVLVEDKATLQELHTWFDGLWATTQPPGAQELDEYMRHVEQHAAQAQPDGKKPKLSGGGVKIRAFLGRLPAKGPSDEVASSSILPAPAHEGTDLSLAVFEIVNLLADDGFTLRDFFELLDDRSSKARRLAMESLYGLCSNWPRSAFFFENTDQLVWQGGRLRQSTPAGLPEAMEPFDQLLGVLIRALDFEEERELPTTDKLARAADIDTRFALKALSAAMSTVLFRSQGEARYLLNDEIEWPPCKRFFMFKRAGLAWDSALARMHRGHVPAPTRLIVPPDPQSPTPSLAAMSSGAPLLTPVHPKTFAQTSSVVESVRELPPRSVSASSDKEYLTKKGYLRTEWMDLLYAGIVNLSLDSVGLIHAKNEYDLAHLLSDTVALPIPVIRRVLAPQQYGWPLRVPLDLKLSKDKDSLQVLPRFSDEEVLVQMPRTQVALRKLAELTSSLPDSDIEPKKPRVASATIDDVYLEIAKWLEVTKSPMLNVNKLEFFRHMEENLNAPHSLSKQAFSGKNTKSNAPFRITTIPDRTISRGENIRVAFYPSGLPFYPKTQAFVNTQANADGFFSRVMGDYRHTKGTGSTHSKNRLDLAQAMLLQLSTKKGVLRFSSSVDLYNYLHPQILGILWTEIQSLISPKDIGSIRLPLRLVPNLENGGMLLVKRKQWSSVLLGFPETEKWLRTEKHQLSVV